MKFKIGDEVNGWRGYTFDPIVGIIEDVINNGRYDIKIIKSKEKGSIGQIWNYDDIDLTLIKSSKITNWKEEMESEI